MKLWRLSIGCNLRFGNLFISTFIIYIYLGFVKIGQQTKVLTFIKKIELTTLKNVTFRIIHVGIFKKHVGNFHTQNFSILPLFCYFANLHSLSIETTKLNLQYQVHTFFIKLNTLNYNLAGWKKKLRIQKSRCNN